MSDMHDIEMNRETFWNLIAQANDKCGEDLEAMALWVEEQLLFMGAEQALCFNDLMYAYVRHAERFGLWTAANILCGGLSDDGFRDFCAWLVSQGKEIYAAALDDPDSLADIAKSANHGFETLNYVFCSSRSCVWPSSALWQSASFSAASIRPRTNSR